MKKYSFILYLAGISLLLSSCTTSGAFISSHETSVKLSEDNYEIVATGVEGSSEAAYVFGFSYSYGMMTQSLSLARISGAPFLYQEALDDLWNNVRSKHGEVKGDQLALANIRYDSDIVNLFLFSKIKLSVRADVVRFTD